MEFKIEKHDNHTLIQVLEEKLDTHIAPTLKSELVLVSGNGEKNIISVFRNHEFFTPVQLRDRNCEPMVRILYAEIPSSILLPSTF